MLSIPVLPEALSEPTLSVAPVVEPSEVGGGLPDAKPGPLGPPQPTSSAAVTPTWTHSVRVIKPFAMTEG
jgi:hypothetical protein